MNPIIVSILLATLAFSHPIFAEQNTLESESTKEDNWRHILILNDINGAYGTVGYDDVIHNAIQHALTHWKIDLVISPGDVIAGQSLSLNQQQINQMWQGFASQILQPFSQQNIPFAPSFGNHDGSKSHEFKPSEGAQKYRFAMERDLAQGFWLANKPTLDFVNDQHFPLFYSFNFHQFSFVAIDASGHQMTAAEMAHLESMLQQVPKEQTVIVFGHLPLTGFAKGRNKFGEVIADSASLITLFKRYHVAMYVSGHQHTYYPAKHQGIFLLNSSGIPARVIASAEGTHTALSTITVLSIHTNSQAFYTQTYELDSLLPFDEQTLPKQVAGYPFSLTKTPIQQGAHTF